MGWRVGDSTALEEMLRARPGGSAIGDSPQTAERRMPRRRTERRGIGRQDGGDLEKRRGMEVLYSA